MVGWTTRAKAVAGRTPGIFPPQMTRALLTGREEEEEEEKEEGGKEVTEGGGFPSLASPHQTSPSGFSRTHSTDLSSSGGREIT